MESTVTVTTAASSINLISLNDLKLELGITNGDQDALLQRYIAQASQSIATYCRRVFGLEAVTEVFRNQGDAKQLVLDRYPVVSIASVTVGTEVLTTDQYEIDKASGILQRLSGECVVCWEIGKIAVAYEAGFALPAASPADLQAACSDLVKLMQSASSRDPLAKRIEIPDIRTVDYWVGGLGANGAISPQVLGRIEPYRDRRI